MAQNVWSQNFHHTKHDGPPILRSWNGIPILSRTNITSTPVQDLRQHIRGVVEDVQWVTEIAGDQNEILFAMHMSKMPNFQLLQDRHSEKRVFRNACRQWLGLALILLCAQEWTCSKIAMVHFGRQELCSKTIAVGMSCFFCDVAPITSTCFFRQTTHRWTINRSCTCVAWLFVKALVRTV